MIKEKRTNFLINLIYLHYIIARYVLTLLTYRCDVHSILELLELFNKFVTKKVENAEGNLKVYRLNQKRKNI